MSYKFILRRQPTQHNQIKWHWFALCASLYWVFCLCLLCFLIRKDFQCSSKLGHRMLPTLRRWKLLANIKKFPRPHLRVLGLWGATAGTWPLSYDIFTLFNFSPHKSCLLKQTLRSLARHLDIRLQPRVFLITECSWNWFPQSRVPGSCLGPTGSRLR